MVVRWILGLVEFLLRDEVVLMMVMKAVEVVREDGMTQVLMEVVVYRSESHQGEMVLVPMVRGHVGRNRHMREAHRWRRGEHAHMYPRRLPHPSRRWSGRLPSTLRVLQRPIAHLKVVEQPLAAQKGAAPATNNTGTSRALSSEGSLTSTRRNHRWTKWCHTLTRAGRSASTCAQNVVHVCYLCLMTSHTVSTRRWARRWRAESSTRVVEALDKQWRKAI